MITSSALERTHVMVEPELLIDLKAKCKRKGYKLSVLTRALYHLWLVGQIKGVRDFYEAVEDQTRLRKSANLKKNRRSGRSPYGG